MTLEILTSDLLGETHHGFFTRKGGASSGIFAGLNCGTGSSDQADVVALNRARVAEAMGAARLEGIHQVHSATAVVQNAPGDGPLPKADAVVTGTPGLVLSVLTADCQPVLMSDPAAGVIAAAHAGWKGAVDGILEATLEAMETLGAERSRTRAVIGPCISQAAYEVGPEFFDRFVKDAPDTERFFASGVDGRYQFDLPGYGLARLQAAGVGQAEWTGHCTYSDASRFFSYRRATHQQEADYGRLIATIRL